MLIKPAPDIRSSEITDKVTYLNRRAFIQTAIGGLAIGALAGETIVKAQQPAAHGRKFENIRRSNLSTTETPNTWQQITTYNNFYEFGVDKKDAATYSKTLKTSPWTIATEGEVTRPAVLHLEEVLKGRALEERIYRHRCVEGWSMVIPWNGFPLAQLIKRFEPTDKAKFVEFTSVERPKEMPGLRRAVLNYPYREGLRMDEAMHPLTILAAGLYGETLLTQNGAPLRLVIPWKYGFKGIKSIVRIRFVDKQQLNSWQDANRDYYGFYANVNPAVPTPSYSQATERRIGEFFMRRTLPFNGYADQVAALYSGMDPKRLY